MKKFAILLSAVLFLTGAVFAAENVGARPAGMGGAFVAISDDANAIFENPAGIGLLHGEHAVVSNKFSDSNYTILGGVEETPFGNFGIGYVSSSSPIDGLTAVALDDLGDAIVSSQNQALIISYGREFNRFSVVPETMGRLSMGANLKISNHLITRAKGLSDNNGSVINADLAALFQPREEFSLGINIKNVLSADSGGDGFGIVAGASAALLDKSVIVSFDSEGRGGVEFRLAEILALRGGIDGGTNTAGIGIGRNGFGVDYAYRGDVHYFSVSLAFNEVPRCDPDAPKDSQASLYNY